MAIYKTITTSPATTTLITKGGTVSGRINKILISNFSDDASDATINVILNYGTTDFYIIKNVAIPKGATLVLDDNVSFDSSKFTLKTVSTGTSPALTIIIK